MLNMDDRQVIQQILDGDMNSSLALAQQTASWTAERRLAFVESLLTHPVGRRWLRGTLLPVLDPTSSGDLARRLLCFEADFVIGHRDSTTSQVVRSLPIGDLRDSVLFFAGSNVAAPFWQRMVEEQPESVARLASDVIASGGVVARETTLYMLLLDPYSEVHLTGADRALILDKALYDPNAGVRGIAAEVLADEAPERLARELTRLVFDESERVRMAAWDAGFAIDFLDARDRAMEIAANEDAAVEPRRAAVAALSAVLDTNEIAPLLQFLVSHPNRVLAEDAVNILWTYHRAPAIAMAASESPHETVRDVAARLLHPETGSPAAGGSRPGAPDAQRDIYQEMLKGYERRNE